MAKPVVARADQSCDFGLPAAAIASLQRVLAQHAGIHRAIVYGSRAKGNYRRGSDIDIALDAPDFGFDAYLRLCTAADDLMLPWQIDLSLLSQIDNPDVLDHIERVGKSLWVRPD